MLLNYRTHYQLDETAFAMQCTEETRPRPPGKSSWQQRTCAPTRLFLALSMSTCSVCILCASALRTICAARGPCDQKCMPPRRCALYALCDHVTGTQATLGQPFLGSLPTAYPGLIHCLPRLALCPGHLHIRTAALPRAAACLFCRPVLGLRTPKSSCHATEQPRANIDVCSLTVIARCNAAPTGPHLLDPCLERRPVHLPLAIPSSNGHAVTAPSWSCAIRPAR